MKKLLAIFTLLFLLSGCQNEKNETTFELDIVLQALKQQNLELLPYDPQHNDTTLHDEKAATYLLNDKPLYIYVFSSKEDRQKGVIEYNEQTIFHDVVSFKMYEKNNVLIFYTHAQVVGRDVPFDKEIQAALDSL